MVHKVSLDWESIEKEYRAGQISIREIARQNNCSAPAITQKAKRLGWVRDLTQKIQQAVNTKLVNKSVNDADLKKENQIVDEYAGKTVELIKELQNRWGPANNLRQKAIDNKDFEALKRAKINTEILLNIQNGIWKAHFLDGHTPTGSEDDPIHVRHSMDTKRLQKALAPKRVEPIMIEGGD